MPPGHIPVLDRGPMLRLELGLFLSDQVIDQAEVELDRFLDRQEVPPSGSS
jgi:hypothetical protein